MEPNQVVLLGILAKIVDFVLVQIGKLFEERREQRRRKSPRRR
jgi:hypothetical protein